MLLAITGSAVAQIAAVVLLVTWLRREERTLRDLGWGRPASASAWIAAVSFTAFWIPSTVFGAMGANAPIFEPSAFNLAGSLLAGPVLGFTEEVVNRGFVMTRLARGGIGRVGQVLTAGLLFGAAHIGWGTLAGGFDARVALGSFIATAFLGLAYAVLYLLGGRSLVPVVASHAASNLVAEPWLALTALQGNL